MKTEPAVIIGVVAAIVVALLQGVVDGTINSFHDVALIALPIVIAFITRAFVTPAPAEPHLH